MPHRNVPRAAAFGLPAQTRRPRADVVRNRARLVAASRELFARHGPDVGMKEIAKAAGVGTGTLYRHFRTKAEILDEVAEQTLDELLTAFHASGDATRTPLVALTSLLAALGEAVARDRGFGAWLAAGSASARAAGEAYAALAAELFRLFAAGQRAGCIRPELTTADASALVSGLATAVRSGGEHRRCVAVLVDGARRPAPR